MILVVMTSVVLECWWLPGVPKTTRFGSFGALLLVWFALMLCHCILVDVVAIIIFIFIFVIVVVIVSLGTISETH